MGEERKPKNKSLVNRTNRKWLASKTLILQEEGRANKRSFWAISDRQAKRYLQKMVFLIDAIPIIEAIFPDKNVIITFRGEGCFKN